MDEATESNHFIRYLESLQEREDRGALATLRRGAGKAPGTVVDMYPLIVPRIPKGVSKWDEEIYYLVATLYAQHPSQGGKGNIGEVMRKVAKKTKSEGSIEKRFIALLNSHREDLFKHMRHSISLSQSHDFPIDWEQLFKDLRNWNHPAGFVQKHWAKSFWGQVRKEDEDRKNNEGSN